MMIVRCVLLTHSIRRCTNLKLTLCGECLSCREVDTKYWCQRSAQRASQLWLLTKNQQTLKIFDVSNALMFQYNVNTIDTVYNVECTITHQDKSGFLAYRFGSDHSRTHLYLLALRLALGLVRLRFSFSNSLGFVVRSSLLSSAYCFAPCPFKGFTRMLLTNLKCSFCVLKFCRTYLSVWH